MKRIAAVVFDMDGVLIDSEVLWRQVREEFAEDLGQTWGEQDQLATMGANTTTWARIMFERLELRERAGFSEATVAQAVIERMIAKYRLHLPLRPGAIEAVHKAAADYRVALATGSPRALAEYVLGTTGLDQVFEATLYGDDMAQGKPAPDVYWAALARIDVAPADAVGIEDSGNGIRSLRAAGMGAIAAPSPEFPLSTEVLALVDAHIDDLRAFSADLVEQVGMSLRARSAR